jgi:hypothetical protein
MYVKAILGFLAFAVLLVVPNERAQASSLSSLGAATAVQGNSSNPTTEVRWHSHYGWHRDYVWPRHYGWHSRHRRHW